MGGVCAIALPTLSGTGCDGPKDSIGEKLPRKPVRAGEVTRYFKVGVYDDLKADNIWLYSDGSYLVALAAVCPHQYCIVKHDTIIGQFTCPCHRSRFSEEGLVKQGSKAKVSLQRCRITRVRVDQTDVVEIDPTVRYLQDKNQWGVTQSMLLLAPE